jgi:predicted MFS family arabinose efflux permease
VTNFFQKSIRLYVNSYAGHPREVWILCIVTFINRLGLTVIPFLTVYLNTILHFDLKLAGLLVGCFGAGSFAGTWVGGKLSDTLGPRMVIFFSLLLGGIFFILLQFVKSPAGLGSMLFLTGFFGDALRPASMATIGNYVPRERTGSAMALFRLAINLGFSAAPAIGGFIAASSLGYVGLFWIDGLTCLAAAAYFIVASRNWRPAIQRDEAPEDSSEEKAVKKELLPPQKNLQYVFFLIATFLMGFGFIQWFHSVPVFMKSEWGFDERYIGIMMALNGMLIVIVEMPLVHQIEHLKRTKKAFGIGALLIAASFLPFLLPAWYGFAILAIMCMTVGEILNLPFSSSFALNLAPDTKRGEYSAWYGMTWSLTNVAGPAIGLSFADEFGWSAFWILIAVMAAGSMLLYRKSGAV